MIQGELPSISSFVTENLIHLNKVGTKFLIIVMSNYEKTARIKIKR